MPVIVSLGRRGRRRRALQSDESGGAAGRVEACEVLLHFRVTCGGLQDFVEDSGEGRVFWTVDAVVHPEAFAAGGDEAGAAQVGQVSRDLGLAGFQAFDEEADADFVVAHEVQQTKTGAVGESFQQSVQSNFLFDWHIWLDGYDSTKLYSCKQIYTSCCER